MGSGTESELELESQSQSQSELEPISVSVSVSAKYDVFLSFRGEDTRKTFMGHLKVSLSAKGIKSFIDDDQIERGRYISTQLIQAIEDSRCSIVIFSPNYASSTWCLDELVKIMDCMKTRGQIVIPIFYNVDPSEIRKQTGRFGESLSVHEQNLKDEEMERIDGWRTALKEVTALAGLDIQNYRDEASFVNEIVEDISSQLCKLVELNKDKDVETFQLLWKWVVRPIAFVLFFYLVVAPLFAYFAFKVVFPLIEYILGMRGTQSNHYCVITIGGKTTRKYGSSCLN